MLSAKYPSSPNNTILQRDRWREYVLLRFILNRRLQRLILPLRLLNSSTSWRCRRTRCMLGASWRLVSFRMRLDRRVCLAPLPETMYCWWCVGWWYSCVGVVYYLRGWSTIYFLTVADWRAAPSSTLWCFDLIQVFLRLPSGLLALLFGNSVAEVDLFGWCWCV